jgi:hypothetical protein
MRAPAPASTSDRKAASSASVHRRVLKGARCVVICPCPSGLGYNPTVQHGSLGWKHASGPPMGYGSITATSPQRLLLILPTLGGARRLRWSKIGCLSLYTFAFSPSSTSRRMRFPLRRVICLSLQGPQPNDCTRHVLGGHLGGACLGQFSQLRQRVFGRLDHEWALSLILASIQ